MLKSSSSGIPESTASGITDSVSSCIGLLPTPFPSYLGHGLVFNNVESAKHQPRCPKTATPHEKVQRCIETVSGRCLKKGKCGCKKPHGFCNSTEFGVRGSSEQAHTVDALATTGDERRGSLRKAAGSWQTSFDPQISEWGNPPARVSTPESIGCGSEPGELKHLSTQRNRNQPRFRQ